MFRFLDRLFSILLVFLFVLCFSGQVSAADQTFIEEIKLEFQNYEKEMKKEYETYREGEKEKYEDFRKKEMMDIDTFTRQVKEDLAIIENQIKHDLNRLKSLYVDTLNLTVYENKIEPYHLNSPMYLYMESIDRQLPNSIMNNYANALNQHYSGSSLHKYVNAINPYTFSSPMYKYANTLNRYFSNSPMSRLFNNSNPHYTNGIMNKYYTGELSKEEASKQWKALLQREDENIKQVISESIGKINEISAASKREVLQRKTETVYRVKAKRLQSLQFISDSRFQSFGEGISFHHFVPTLHVPKQEKPLINKGFSLIIR